MSSFARALTRPLARPLALSLLLAAFGCAPPAPPRSSPAGLVRDGTPASVDIALARLRGRTRTFEWAELSPETLARARREGRFILLDGAAEWCHWCHVMDATTYTDPEIGALLRERFIAVRVDVDERPDIAERYGEWGWPATILLSPEAEELGKYRGYLPPEELRDILQKVTTLTPALAAPESGPADRPPPAQAMAWVAGRATLDMDAYYDPREGGWGRKQKAPLGANVTFELLRASHGDSAALARATFSLSKHRSLIDPVWGGIYQYSAGSSWNDPHFEKLMTYQADNLEACARAFALTRDEASRRDALSIAGYMTTFLSSAEGAFLPTQDADVGSHEPGDRFVDGHVYYALGDAQRRALGVPRVDPHVYPFENGLAIAALVTLHEATSGPRQAASSPTSSPTSSPASSPTPSPDAPWLAKARRAADLVLRAFVTPEGLVKREGKHAVRYLADAASFGRALVRLHAATGEARYLDSALAIARVLVRDLDDPTTGAFFDHTVDPAATGVFARRVRALPNNVLAARFLAALAASTKDPTWNDRARRALASVSTPRALDAAGRMLGEYALALDETGLYPW